MLAQGGRFPQTGHSSRPRSHKVWRLDSSGPEPTDSCFAVLEESAVVWIIAWMRDSIHQVNGKHALTWRFAEPHAPRPRGATYETITAPAGLPRLLLPRSGHKHFWQWHHSGVNWQVIRGPRRFSSSRGRQCAPVNGNLLVTFVVARRVCFLVERRWIVELVDLEPIDWLMRFRCASYPQKKISIWTACRSIAVGSLLLSYIMKLHGYTHGHTQINTSFYALLGIIPRKTNTQIKDFELNLTVKVWKTIISKSVST